jgi:small neutral amino acid transporter SnatA (MarC family)
MNKHNNSSDLTITILLLFFMIIWMILGISAFIMSLVCFGYNSSISEKIIGLLLSIFLGPLFWLYYWLNKTYCI